MGALAVSGVPAIPGSKISSSSELDKEGDDSYESG